MVKTVIKENRGYYDNVESRVTRNKGTVEYKIESMRSVMVVM